MEIHEIESNGKKYSFNVVKNSTEPCPECGVPAFGKEDIVWGEDNGQRFAIIFDGGYFDLAIEELIGKNLHLLKSDSLPIFLKQWNESIGWVDCCDYDGYELDIEDFLNSLILLKSCDLGKWISEEEIIELENLAIKANSKGLNLKIARG
ncbi:MAG: hypothetical protein R2852_09570 [Bacteroidia bacterium]